ncbi:MAG: UDP-N-acetylmuramoyl-L-alanyl-D-glutamate--2,6-diaminopimelate ligase [Acidobacteriota bacterium]|nr:UDP-N-acetylmuramoyl-L-alanyl-D-glutamate--2,6-diaminopimelate ligase [Acidobacteriota bacterium]
MKLSALAAEVPHHRAGPVGDPEILAVTHDSRAAAPGTLFAALPGLKADGRHFIADAVQRGAVAALGLAPAPAGTSVPYLEVENARRSAGLMAALLAGRPSEKLVMAGVTGTSGKTTTTYLLEGLLAGRHPKRGIFGTIVYRGAGGDAAAIASPHTTPEATELQPMLQALAAGGGTAAIMECSSHALVLERLAGCAFDVAVFLNISREHLDFHRDMDDYFEAKARLFGLLKPNGKAVVNLGDPYGMRLASRLIADRTVGFFLEGEEGKERAAGSLFATVVGRATLKTTGTTLDVEAGGASFTIHSPLLGRPNAENLLAAAAAGLALGLSPAEISEGLGAVASVPGRLEPVPNALGLTVLVDYAHKPAALEGVLKTVRTIAAARGGRVIAVFGCGGDRDKGKRPEMGRIAALLADEVVVTSDNPRSEDPERILREVRAGVEAAGKTAHYVVDRREALAAAFRLARAGDVVLVAGKGHETEQIVGGLALPFDDRLVARALLEEYAGAAR